MLDRKYIVENADAVQQNCVNRGVEADVKKLVGLESQRREVLETVQDFNRRANEVSKSIGKAKDDAEREARKEEGRKLRDQKDTAQKEHDEIDAQIVAIQRLIPNLSHDAAPIGKDDKANLEIRKGKHEPPKFDFDVLDHVDIGEKLDLFDFAGGARTTGHGFYFLKNDAVLLELALQHFVVQKLVKEGFTPAVTPDMARREILEGIGFSPRGNETQIYSIEGSAEEESKLCLVATAEITLGGWYSGVTFDSTELPLHFCGLSHCYRTEAGAHGRTTRGLYRVHQFSKVEMFAFTLPEDSEATLDRFCALECEIFDDLEVPYRVVDTATGDLGGPAYRKFDLEAWMPGRGDNGEYGEVTSTSNCTDYQARRLNIRYKTKGEKGTRYVHTLNGTAIAISRGIIAVLENHQQADGSVKIPKVLQPMMGKDTIVPKS